MKLNWFICFLFSFKKLDPFFSEKTGVHSHEYQSTQTSKHAILLKHTHTHTHTQTQTHTHTHTHTHTLLLKQAWSRSKKGKKGSI